MYKANYKAVVAAILLVEYNNTINTRKYILFTNNNVNLDLYGLQIIFNKKLLIALFKYIPIIPITYL